MLETTIRVANSSNVGQTGLTGTEIKFRRSPYGSGDVITIAGVSGSVNGIYLCSFIGNAYEAAQLWISGVYQSTWGTKYIGDVFEEFLSKDTASSQTMSGAIAMGSNKITGVGDATTAGDALTYAQAIRVTGNQTGIAGLKVFTDLLSMSPSTISITGDGTLTTKKYVDDLFGGAVGFVQSTQKVKLVPSRSVEDSYSRTTLGGCISVLDTSSSKRGNIVIESMNIAGNTYALSTDENWVADRIDITGENLPIINVTSSAGNSVTASAKLKCIYLYNSGSTNWTLVNFTFEDCVLYFNGNLTLTNPVFRGTNGIRLPNTKTLTITNSTGHGTAIYNDDIATVTITGTQCKEISGINVSNLGIS